MSQEQRLNPNEQQPLELEEIVVNIEGEIAVPPEPPAKDDQPLQRPDPTFKRVVEKGAEEWEMGSGPTELKTKQLTSPDLFLEVPPGTKLDGSPFEFFRRYNIIEFKSRNDQLTYGKYIGHLARVLIWNEDREEVAHADILNVIVSARRPDTLYNRLAKRGRKFTQLYDKVAGIYIERSELNDVVLVVCSELPVEPKYAMWLLFVAPTTEQWRAAIRMMAKYQMVELLEEARGLYPKEYKAMNAEVESILANYYKPEEREEYLQALLELAEDSVKNLEPEQRSKLIARLPTAERLKGLPAEEIARALPAEEIARALPVEERLKGLPVEERTKELTPEEKKRLLKQLQQELGEIE